MLLLRIIIALGSLPSFPDIDDWDMLESYATINLRLCGAHLVSGLNAKALP